MISAKHLPHQEAGEKIELFLKRHWFVFFTKMLFFIFLLILPMIFFYYTGEDIYGPLDGDISRPIFMLVISIYFLSIWLFFTASFINDFLDYWIVTSKRIISIDQLSLFARSVSELKLINVQDVTSEIKGFFPTILHFGDIQIQSAGARSHFVFKQVPHADEVTRQILHLAECCKREHAKAMISSHKEL